MVGEGIIRPLFLVISPTVESRAVMPRIVALTCPFGRALDGSS